MHYERLMALSYYRLQRWHLVYDKYLRNLLIMPQIASQIADRRSL